MSESMFVRVLPVTRATKGKAERVSVGGQLFLAGNWYELSAEKAGSISDLEQAPGVKFFQVLTTAEYRDTVEMELKAAARAAGFDGIGSQAAPPPVISHKAGAKPSKFAGLASGVREVPASGRVGAPQQAPVAVPAAKSAKSSDGIGVTREMLKDMSLAQLRTLAEANAVDYVPKASKAMVRESLIDQLGL